jgi:peptide/nickel transport system ATP-binding protein
VADPTRPPLLRVEGLKKYFPIKGGFLQRTVGTVKAVDDVSFTVHDGEILSLVGESGCGKTTTARCVLRAQTPTAGKVLFRTAAGEVLDLATLPERQVRPVWREMQMIFQDPFGSLNPRKNLLEIIGEPLFVQGVKSRQKRMDRVAELLNLVGLRPEYMHRFPHAFSGGQRQRVVIARALALEPRLVVADEAVSALDVSVQAQILNLLLDLQRRLDLSYLFVAHDLSIVKHISHRVAVMYVGKIVELAPTEALFHRPKHPYTAALMKAVPVADPDLRGALQGLPGEVANPANPPTGCYFHPRCPFAVDTCRHEQPQLRELQPGHFVACHRAEELDLDGIADLDEARAPDAQVVAPLVPQAAPVQTSTSDRLVAGRPAGARP